MPNYIDKDILLNKMEEQYEDLENSTGSITTVLWDLVTQFNFLKTNPK